MRTLVAGVGCALLLALSQPAFAYCRTTTCDPSTEDCSPDAGEYCTTKGIPLFWPQRCTSYDLQRDPAQGITYDEFSAIAAKAFGAWVEADCGNSVQPSIGIKDLGPATDLHACYNQCAGNVNAVLFQADTWPYENSANTLALTTVTFNTQNGEIYDADMEINGTAGVHLTVTDTNVDYDLQSILTHEAGHFYGLAHYTGGGCSSVMCPTYKEKETTLRTLTADDIAGICAIYPPDRSVGPTCDPTPRHGFSVTCESGDCGKKKGCCSNSTTPARTPGQGGAALAALGLGLAVWRFRRRKRA